MLVWTGCTESRPIERSYDLLDLKEITVSTSHIPLTLLERGCKFTLFSSRIDHAQIEEGFRIESRYAGT